MNRNLHDIDHLFLSTLQDYEELPSERAKKNLQAALDMQAAKRRRRKAVVWKYTAYTCLGLLCGVVADQWLEVDGTPAAVSTETLKKQPDASNKATQQLTESATTLKPDNKEAGDATVFAAAGNQKANESTAEQSGSEKEVPANLTVQDKGRPALVTTAVQTRNTKELKSVRHSAIPRPETVQNKLPIHLPAVGSFRNFEWSSSNRSAGPARRFLPYWTVSLLRAWEISRYAIDSDLPATAEKIKSREEPEVSFTTSLFISRQLTKKWAVQSGLQFFNTRIALAPQKIYALTNSAGNIAFKYQTSSGYAFISPATVAPPAFGDSLATQEGKHSLQAISLPFVVQYTTSHKKLAVVPFAGIEANFLIQAKIETEIETPGNKEMVSVKRLEGMKSFYASALIGSELRYTLNQKTQVSVRPSFRYALSPITENNVVETFPYSVGIGLGLIKKF